VKIVRCSNLQLLDKIFVVASTLATTVELEQWAVADDNGDTPCTVIRKELYKATVRTLQSVICINITQTNMALYVTLITFHGNDCANCEIVRILFFSELVD